MFGYQKGMLLNTESVSERTIALPFYNHLSEDEIEIVCMSLKHELIMQKKQQTVYQSYIPKLCPKPKIISNIK